MLPGSVFQQEQPCVCPEDAVRKVPRSQLKVSRILTRRFRHKGHEVVAGLLDGLRGLADVVVGCVEEWSGAGLDLSEEGLHGLAAALGDGAQHVQGEDVGGALPDGKNL